MYCIHTECSSRCVDVWKLTQKSSFFFLVWVPIFDGEFITDTPKNLLESGKINQKDVMIGERLTCVGFDEDANATYWQIARGLSCNQNIHRKYSKVLPMIELSINLKLFFRSYF